MATQMSKHSIITWGGRVFAFHEEGFQLPKFQNDRMCKRIFMLPRRIKYGESG